MKKIAWVVAAFFGLNPAGHAQSISFSKDIAPVFYKKCSSCHNDNGPTPFSINSYKDIASNLNSIKYAIAKRIMPPSKAENDSVFINARNLGKSEIAAIDQWIKEGANNDKENLVYKASATHSFDEPGKPDVILKVTAPFKITGNNTEQFVSFVIDPKFVKGKILRAVALKPGNRKAVHHMRLEYDTTGYVKMLGGNSGIYNTNNVDAGKVQSIIKVGFYVPGLNYCKFPEKAGLTLPANGIFTLNIHYAPIAVDAYDQSEVYLYFMNEKDKERDIQNIVVVMDRKNIILPRDSISHLSYISQPFDSAFCITAVEPHMHLIGKSIKVELISPSRSDSTLLINIPDWDFNWQEFYFFKKGIVAPKGSYVRLTATYNNTTNNPKNPFYPPRNVDFGDMKTTNEMLGAIIQGFVSKSGDPVFDLSKDYR